MKSYFILCLTFLLSYTLSGQYATINFDAAMKTFNNYEPLPSEEDLMITGAIPPTVDVVEINFFRSKDKEHKEPLSSTIWQRGTGNNQNTFKLPVNYKLNANKKYDVQVKFFRAITTEERAKLYAALNNNLDAYLGQNVGGGKKRIKLAKSTKQIVKDLNTIVKQGLGEYRVTNGVPFDGFSDLVKTQIDQLDDKKINQFGSEKNNPNAMIDAMEYRGQLIRDLKAMIHSEVRFVMNNDVSRLTNRFDMDDLKTEERSGYFSINVGYGAVFLDGKLDNLQYGRSPYVGLAFPLSTSTIAPRFFRNASITLGVFTSNFDDEERGRQITGPIIKRPIYLGLDYKLFQFIRFNVGASFLEEKGDNNGQISGIENRVFVRPFIGLSAKINLSVGLDK